MWTSSMVNRRFFSKVLYVFEPVEHIKQWKVYSKLERLGIIYIHIHTYIHTYTVLQFIKYFILQVVHVSNSLCVELVFLVLLWHLISPQQLTVEGYDLNSNGVIEFVGNPWPPTDSGWWYLLEIWMGDGGDGDPDVVAKRFELKFLQYICECYFLSMFSKYKWLFFVNALNQLN